MTDIGSFIGGSVFTFLIVFVRLGATFLIMPIFGEQFVSARIRLLLALTISLVTVPVVAAYIPSQPDNPAELLVLILGEVLIGLFIGTIARTMLTALEVAGFLIANQIGLSAAQAFNPTMASPGNPVSGILGMLALLLIFATDLHHMLILAAVDSYVLFAPGEGLPLGDAAQHLVRVVSASFLTGFQMSAPFVVIGLLFFLGLGLIARLAPQIQIFFVSVPLQIGLGTLLLGLSLSSLILYWLQAFEAQLIALLQS